MSQVVPVVLTTGVLVVLVALSASFTGRAPETPYAVMVLGVVSLMMGLAAVLLTTLNMTVGRPGLSSIFVLESSASAYILGVGASLLALFGCASGLIWTVRMRRPASASLLVFGALVPLLLEIGVLDYLIVAQAPFNLGTASGILLTVFLSVVVIAAPLTLIVFGNREHDASAIVAPPRGSLAPPPGARDAG
ncbi:MAG: hypothetical protein ACHQ4H_02595 [Ktedonobacterales bacterium]